MKANELMIGDWMYVNGLTQQVFDLAYNQNEKELTIGVLDPQGDVYQCFYGFDHVEPIPLTAEILKKNGFKNDVSVFEQNMRDVRRNFSRLVVVIEQTEEFAKAKPQSPNYIIKVGSDMLELALDYVHELQHALRLCGIEKEIEL